MWIASRNLVFLAIPTHREKSAAHPFVPPFLGIDFVPSALRSFYMAPSIFREQFRVSGVE
jgi:hypothetical protein